MNITKKKQTQRYRQQTSSYQWGEGKGKGNIGVGDYEVQTVMYKISYKGTSLAVLWLRLCTSTAEGRGFDP